LFILTGLFYERKIVKSYQIEMRARTEKKEEVAGDITSAPGVQIPPPAPKLFNRQLPIIP